MTTHRAAIIEAMAKAIDTKVFHGMRINERSAKDLALIAVYAANAAGWVLVPVCLIEEAAQIANYPMYRDLAARLRAYTADKKETL